MKTQQKGKRKLSDTTCSEGHAALDHLSTRGLKKKKKKKKKKRRKKILSDDTFARPSTLSNGVASRRSRVYPCVDKHTKSLIERDWKTKNNFVTKEKQPLLFDKLRATAYEGFRVEGPGEMENNTHVGFETVFRLLEEGGAFLYDVTQPRGLGTPLAKTFVKRTLVGDPGITYKYLGLRMFGLPWSSGSRPSPAANDADRKMRTALGRMKKLNDTLVQRTNNMLRSLSDDRRRRCTRHAGEPVGSAKYNLTLINRMSPSSSPEIRLKDEPVFRKQKCSVSWHADSTLQHFSTIAVYHQTDRRDVADWSVALRVSRNAEGPSAGSILSSKNVITEKKKEKKVVGEFGLGNARASSPRIAQSDDDRTPEIPPIAVPLPSHSCYYLLDDFNHHHQHAVLSGESLRYASTHRVCRFDGHVVSALLSRCKSIVLRASKRNTLKQWRAEQALLDEIEFEWIRQFFVQGEAHARLRRWWHDPMAELGTWWSHLEERTANAIRLLKSSVSSIHTTELQSLTKSERRREEKRRKSAKSALSSCQLDGVKAFDLLIDFVRTRASRREMWKARCSDRTFLSVPANCRPLPLPLFRPSEWSSGIANTATDAGIPSPLPEDLAPLVSSLSLWRSAYLSTP